MLILSDHSTISIKLQIASAEQSEILIAQLSDIEFYAFEEEKGVLIAYIKETDFDEGLLLNCLPASLSYRKEKIAEKNWNSQWESDFQPVIVNDFAAVRAEFHEPVKGIKHDLIITPRMSFGTGHHATTFMMIQLMEEIDFKNKSVIDFGTGTGVLAILAEKLGAREILAIDMDEWSINNTIENVAANKCNNIRVEQKNNLTGINEADIILANINLNVLTEYCKEIAGLTKPGGMVLTSGFLQPDETKIIESFTARGCVRIKEISRDNWSSILFKKL